MDNRAGPSRVVLGKVTVKASKERGGQSKKESGRKGRGPAQRRSTGDALEKRTTTWTDEDTRSAGRWIRKEEKKERQRI